jgi:U3 small nucleolar RNA-associated protein 6
MAAASDKARYFLEQSVPELKEYEKKGIFSAEEITSIARKRSDFEHKINARGSTPADYARYAEFEINVDALRRKRVKRLGIKATAYSGKRRIFFVFDRGTRKHPGDVGLWMQTIEFARKQKAYKKLQEIFTNVLRLHPTKSELWIYAAQFAVEDNGDMTEARSYMQRGLRFCKNGRNMWLEYGRLEMSYIAKIHARREILGIGANRTEEGAEVEDNENLMKLPRLTAVDINPDLEGGETDTTALENLESTPAMSGAIPMAIFDAAMAQFDDLDFALDFFNMVVEYDQLATCRRIASHITDNLLTTHPMSWQSSACYIRTPLVSLAVTDPEYPQAFRQFLTRLREAQKKNDKNRLDTWVQTWLNKLVQEEYLDLGIKTVGESVLRSLSNS